MKSKAQLNLKDNIILNKKKRKTIKNKNVQPVFLIDYKVVNKNIIKSGNKNSVKNNLRISRKKTTNNETIKFSQKNYSLIQIDANNKLNKKPPSSDFLLDNYDYDSAIKYDKRSFCRLFYICVIAKENIINILVFKTPLDIQSLRICLFLFSYSCDLAFNTIFYSNQNISDKYHYNGNNLFLFTMVNNFLQTILSAVVGLILVNIFQHMIDSRGAYEDIFISLKVAEGFCKRVNGASKLKVAAETYCMIFKTTKKLADCYKVCESLCRVVVAASSRVDDRAGRILACKMSRPLFWSSHCNYIGITGNYADCVGKRFALYS